jgi:predicted nuclease with TOPRIM domain
LQILVMGMHRSGTSVVTQLLNAAGAFVGADDELMVPMPDNPTGYWERYDVCALNDSILDAADARWDTATGDEIERLSPSQRRRFAGEIRDLVHSLDEHQPWVVKDPRLSITFPLWRGLLDRPVCVLCHRDPAEVAMSLRNRDGIPLIVGAALWDAYNLAALRSTSDIRRLFVDYHGLLDDPRKVGEELLSQIDGTSGTLHLGRSSIDDIVRGDLHRSTVGDRERAMIVSNLRSSLRGVLIAQTPMLEDLNTDGLPMASEACIRLYADTGVNPNRGTQESTAGAALNAVVQAGGRTLNNRLPAQQFDVLHEIVQSGTIARDELRALVLEILDSVNALEADLPSVRSDVSTVLELQQHTTSEVLRRNEALNSQNLELHASRTAIAQQLERMESELASKTQQYDALQSHSAELRALLAEVGLRNTELADELAHLHERLPDLETRITQVQAQQKEALAKQAHMNAEIEMLQARATRTGERAEAVLTELFDQMNKIERGFADGGTPNQIVAAVRFCIAEAVNELQDQIDEQLAHDPRLTAGIEETAHR